MSLPQIPLNFLQGESPYPTDGSYKYSLSDDEQQFIRHGFRLHKIGEDEPRFGLDCNMIKQTYDLVNFFFHVLQTRESGFFGNRNIIMRNLEKVHMLLYRLEEDKYFSDTEPKLTNLIKGEEYQDLIFTDLKFKRQYILVGWTLIHISVFICLKFSFEDITLDS
jgi:hypothetical protein